MLEWRLISFSRGLQMLLLVVLFVGLTACTTLNSAEKKTVFAPPDINQRTAISAKRCPPFADSDRLALEEGAASAGEAAGSIGEPLCPPADGLGIKITGIQWSAAGYMLNFRYTVINPAEALPMFDRSVIPYLVHEKSGARFMVPSPAKLGPFRTTGAPEEGRIYYTMFANPGRYVQQGDLVTVVVGEHRFEHLTVK
ncbi:MAG: hypothetical protein ABFS18_09960 [Thermodesulfobacteriota bacterium]